MKHSYKLTTILGILALSSASSHAQLKTGSNPSTITANTNLEIEATNGNKVTVSKDTGKVKIADGTQGIDKVLTSDANGVATWGAPTYKRPATSQSVGSVTTPETSFTLSLPTGNSWNDPGHGLSDINVTAEGFYNINIQVFQYGSISGTHLYVLKGPNGFSAGIPQYITSAIANQRAVYTVTRYLMPGTYKLWILTDVPGSIEYNTLFNNTSTIACSLISL